MEVAVNVVSKMMCFMEGFSDWLDSVDCLDIDACDIPCDPTDSPPNVFLTDSALSRAIQLPFFRLNSEPSHIPDLLKGTNPA